MSNNNRMNIYEILDRFNQEVGFDGLDNDGKVTDERDDVITRQIFNNWLRSYNRKYERKIRSKKKDQYNNEWYRTDVEKLIKTEEVQDRLEKLYKKKTVPINVWQDPSKSIRVSKKKYEKYFVEGEVNLSESIQKRVDRMVEDLIKSNFTLEYQKKELSAFDYLSIEKIVGKFIDMEKVVEVAFKIEDGFYATLEYDDSGHIINEEIEGVPGADYYLK